MDGVLIHKTELEKKGLGPLVEVISQLQENLKEGSKQFNLNLSPLGENESIQFTRLENGYTADIVKNQEINKQFGIR